MKSPIQKQQIVFISLVLLLQACNTVAAAPTNTASAVASVTEIPLSQRVTLTYISFREQGQAPTYTISAQTPKLAGTDDPRAQAFNDGVEKIVLKEIEYFRKNVLAQMPAQSAMSGSSFDVQYTVVLQQGNLWSLKFNFSGYADGAAHPYQYNATFNFDLERGEKLSLGDLFPPDSDFLTVISRHCISELTKRDIGFYGGFQQGAEPTTDNYRNWNIAADGLLITFDEYQVAPYAAGTQTVIIPYSELNPLISSKSPLAVFSR
jgi:hypothetical protein